jgi:hypothetical protein
VFGLTRQQKWIVGLTAGLLLLGWIVKTWRLAEPKMTPKVQTAE